MKRKLCTMLLLAALLLIGISSLFAYPPPQVNAGGTEALRTTNTVEVINNANGGGIPTILDDEIFAIGRIT
jgi:hypothetical protein